jgi:hypothetical protein
MKKESVAIFPLQKFGETFGLNRYPLDDIRPTAEFYERQSVRRRMHLCIGVEIDTKNCNQSKQLN